MRNAAEIRTLVRRRAAAVVRERRRVRARGGSAAVHDLRVATRRLQEVLRVCKPFLPTGPRRRLWRRARRIRSGLGAVRDADVLVVRIGSLARHLPISERRAAQAIAAQVRAAAREVRSGARGARSSRGLPVPGVRRRVEALLRATRRSAVPVATRGRRAADASLRAAARLLAGARRGDPEDLHALRIRIKRYRYALEIVEESGHRDVRPAIAEARRLQRCLGRVHDLDVLAALVRGWTSPVGERRLPGGRPAVRALLRRLDADRQRAVGDVRRTLDQSGLVPMTTPKAASRRLSRVGPARSARGVDR